MNGIHEWDIFSVNDSTIMLTITNEDLHWDLWNNSNKIGLITYITYNVVCNTALITEAKYHSECSSDFD